MGARTFLASAPAKRRAQVEDLVRIVFVLIVHCTAYRDTPLVRRSGRRDRKRARANGAPTGAPSLTRQTGLPGVQHSVAPAAPGTTARTWAGRRVGAQLPCMALRPTYFVSHGTGQGKPFGNIFTFHSAH
jgi:hypothetical protein